MNPNTSRWFRCALMLAPVMAAAGVAAGAEAYIVKEGKPLAEIVIAEKPARMTAFAARELREHVEKITGARLPVVTNPAPGSIRLYVGPSAHTESLKLATNGLAHGAYRMASGPDWLALLGPDKDFTPIEPWARARADKARVLAEWDAVTGDTFGSSYLQLYARRSPTFDLWELDDRGTLNAVYAFLGGLGVRWYFPGDLGTIVPKTNSIALPAAGNRAVTPDFALRKFSFFSDQTSMSDDEFLWQLRMGLNLGPELLGLTLPCHGSKFVYTRDEMKQNHPEFYALWGGKRATIHRECGAPCLSSEGLFQEHLKYAEAVFNHYNEPMLSLDVCDGYGASLCECERCRVQGATERGWRGQMSDYVWGYVNRVALELLKTHPDRKVSGLSYSAYQLPPEKIDKLSPNLSLIMCQTRNMFHNRELREQSLKMRDAWLAKLPSKELFMWDYYLHNRPGNPYEGVPSYFPGLIAEDLRALKGKSRGELIEVYRHRDPKDYPWDALAVMHLNCYVTSRLWWNADQDLGALMEEYYANLYGPAAKEMKAFITFSEANWPLMTSQAAAIDKVFELLAAAKRAAGDSVYGKRVDLIAAYVQPLKLLRERLSKGREDVPEVRSLLRTKSTLTLDGKLDDPFWADTRDIELREILTGKPPAEATRVRVAWGDDDALYLGIRCEESDMANLKVTGEKRDDTNIWLGDLVEILVETPIHSYYQIVINPAGTIVDLVREKSGARDTLWTSGATVAAVKGDGFWTLEVRIPAAGEMAREIDPKNGVAGRRPSATYPWFVNVCRQRARGADMELSAWSPTGKKTFHDAMKFGKLYVK